MLYRKVPLLGVAAAEVMERAGKVGSDSCRCAERATRRRNQPGRERIADRVRRRAPTIVRGHHRGHAAESDGRAVIALLRRRHETYAVAAAQHGFGMELIGEAEPWLEVCVAARKQGAVAPARSRIY